jgi:hypothetical protein
MVFSEPERVIIMPANRTGRVSMRWEHSQTSRTRVKPAPTSAIPQNSSACLGKILDDLDSYRAARIDRTQRI